MARRRDDSGMNMVAIVLVALVVVAVGLGLALSSPQQEKGREEEVKDRPQDTEVKVPAEGEKPKRLAVANAPGYFVVIEPDGSSYMETPDGKRTKLTGPTPKFDAVIKAVTSPRATPMKKEVGQLVVCDSGVVDVPRDAVITFIGPDKVVTLDPADGSSSAYYTDGRIVRIDRESRGRMGSGERRP